MSTYFLQDELFSTIQVRRDLADDIEFCHNPSTSPTTMESVYPDLKVVWSF